MNFGFAEQINFALEKLDIKEAIEIAETKLGQLPETEYHEVIGRSLVGRADELVAWIDQFYQAVQGRISVKALYFEMNEFDINTDCWYIDCFAYSRDGGLNPDDMEWLCEFEASNNDVLETIFVIEEYEKLQKAFEDDTSGDLGQDARDWCEQVIIARFMELMRAAHMSAKEKRMTWADVPVYFTEHAYDFIVRSEVN